jgi:phenol 2-monooxygenase
MRFGFAERLLRRPIGSTRTVFWKPDPDDRSKIVRSGRIQDTEDWPVRFPHVIVNQARVHDYLLEVMRESPSKLVPHYNLHATNVTSTGRRLSRDRHAAANGPDRQGQKETGPGALRRRLRWRTQQHQAVDRRALVGDVANHAWGVMDVLAGDRLSRRPAQVGDPLRERGDHPHHPREGGYLVRFYIDLGKLRPDQHLTTRGHVERASLIATANRIIHPYTLEVKNVVWWSVYEVGQRLCDKFDDVPLEEMSSRALPRVFIAGDAWSHAQRKGRARHERLHAGHVQSRLEARGRCCRARAHPRCCTRYSANGRRSPRC